MKNNDHIRGCNGATYERQPPYYWRKNQATRYCVHTSLVSEVLNGEKSRTKFDIIDKKTK